MKPRFLTSCLVALWFCFAFAALAQGDGAEVYKSQCLKCHGETGTGDGPAAQLLGIPMGDLTDQDVMNAYSDEDLYKLVSEGGKALGKSKVMPAYKDKLTEDQIKAVISHVKTFYE